MQLTHNNKTLKFDKPKIMGILNVTPDSFSDGGDFVDTDDALSQARLMLNQGADIIDIGGESSRPFAEPVPVEVELKRVIPVIDLIRKELGDQFWISVDTYKSQVAKQAIQAGADIINDISAFSKDEKMVTIAAELSCPVVLMHMKGTPKTMQAQTPQYTDVISQVSNYLKKRADFCIEHGVRADNIVLDPGLGFGKTVQHNLIITRDFAEFTKLEYPLLYGISRKSTTGKVMMEYMNLKEIPEPKDRLEPSLAAAGVALQNGANIIRTHDVLETVKYVSMTEAIKNL